MMKTTRAVALGAMFAALICAATVVIQIPAPGGGYINAGDGLILVAAWTLPTVLASSAAAIGASAADLLTGYAVYAPGTLVIKAATALVACLIFSRFPKKSSFLPCRLVSAFCAEVVMVVGYFGYDTLLYGAKGALSGIIPNLIQAAGGIVLSLLLAGIFSKININFKSR